VSSADAARRRSRPSRIRYLERRLARAVERRIVVPLEHGVLDRRPRAHFLHVGKAGGTVLKEALGDHRSEGRYQIVLHDHRFTLGDTPRGEKVFCVLRDPIERFVSAFNYRLREGKPHQYDPWIPGEERAFTTFSTPDALATALSSGDPALRAEAHAAMTSIRHVRDSYWRWFDSSEYLQTRLDDVLLVQWLPDLESTFSRLLRELGLPGTIALPRDEPSANRTPDGTLRSLSGQSKANLALWYGVDYGLLDYCSSLPSFAGPSYHGMPTRADHEEVVAR
jgi:hypothetical protein